MKRITSIARHIAFALCAALSATLFSGCVSVNFSPLWGDGVTGSGSLEAYNFSVGEITDIKVQLHCDINYYSSPSDTVKLEIQPNLCEYISVEESGGVLTVRATRNINWSGKTPVLTVGASTLNSLSLAGAGVFTAHDTITADSFALSVDGAGKGIAELDVINLSVNMTGAASFELRGRADVADINLAGAGTAEALSLQTRDATINISGVGTVKLSCSENLSINAGGMGTVEYKGSPSVSLDNDGLVSVKKVG